MRRAGGDPLSRSPKGAEVKINGESKRKTPLELELAPGEYSVSLKLSGYRTGKKTVTLAEGKAPKPLKLKLKKTTKKVDHSSENVEIDPEEGVVTKFEVPRGG